MLLMRKYGRDVPGDIPAKDLAEATIIRSMPIHVSLDPPGNAQGVREPLVLRNFSGLCGRNSSEGLIVSSTNAINAISCIGAKSALVGLS